MTKKIDYLIEKLEQEANKIKPGMEIFDRGKF